MSQTRYGFTWTRCLAWLVMIAVLGGVMYWHVSCSGKKEEAEPAPEGPTYSAYADFRRCADGTLYYIAEDETIYWIVKGKATPVEVPGGIAGMFDAEADPWGGLYVMGETDLFYLYAGKAIKVPVVKYDQILGTDYIVTPDTFRWSIRPRMSVRVNDHESDYDEE